MRTRSAIALLPIIAMACSDGADTLNRRDTPDEPGVVNGNSVDGELVISPQVVRLTNLAYTRSIRDLFPGVTIPDLPLPAAPDGVVYDNNAIAQAPTPSLVAAYQTNAVTVAQAVTSNLGKVLPCAANVDDACAQTYVSDLASRAYRHPLREDEKSRLLQSWSGLRAKYDPPTSIGIVVQGILQAPAFLYAIEQGKAIEGSSTLVRLTGNELATRMALLFWSSIPDSDLRSVADNDALLSVATIESQARRMLADPRAHDSVAHMHYQWLRFSKMEKLVKDSTLFPSWNDTVAQSMRESTAKFVDHVFWEENSLQAFFTDKHGFVNASVAPFYGLSGVTGTDLSIRDLDPSQRGGILTQPGLLAAFGNEREESPVFRGVFVLDRLLCAPPPPAPPDVKNTPPAPTNVETTTTRERFQAMHEIGACAGCHKVIDGVGFGFEHYDAVGKWRDIEGGKPVDATGEIHGTDVDGPFNGIPDLNSKLAKSDRAAMCVAKNWLQYGMGVDPAAASQEVVTPLFTKFKEKPTFSELLVALTKSSTFRYRTVAQ